MAKKPTNLPSTTYIDIDSLFDVRMVILKWIAPHVAYDVVQDKSYFTRVKDIFKTSYITLTYDHIEPFYKKRNKAFLKQALPTHIYSLLEMDVLRHRMDNTNGKGLEPYKFLINTYPYNLNKEERENIKRVLISSTATLCEFEFIYKEPRYLTPAYLNNEGVERMVIRDLYSWINAIDIREFRENPRHDKVILTPKILNTSGLSTRDLTSKFFEDLKATLTPYGDIEFLDALMFSMHYVELPPRDKNKNMTSTR